MPELPEVETVRRGLSQLIIGRTIGTAEAIDSPKSFPNAPSEVAQFMVGASVTAVRRRAKVLLIDLSSEYTIVVHLKMTGQLVFVGVGSVNTCSPPLPPSPSEAASPRRDLPSPNPRKAAELAPIGATVGLRQSSLCRVLGSANSRVPADVSEEEMASGGSPVATRASAMAFTDLPSSNSQLPSSMSAKPTPQLPSTTEPSVRFGAGHPTDSLVGVLPDRSTRVVVEFMDGSHLFFNDQRKFGWVKLFPTVEVPNIDFMKKVGPEPLESNFTTAVFWERLQRRKNTTIKAAILDQTVLAGVGNIYADEGLWGARIHPATRVKDVPRPAIDDLWRELRDVMTLAIEKGGSTDKNYVNAEGKRGSYMDFARVFRREGQACPRHPDVLIEKIKVAGRGTHICAVCQPAVHS